MLRHALALLALSATGLVQAAMVRYDFQDFWGDILAPSSVPAHVSATRAGIDGPWGSSCWNTDLGGTNDFACGGFGSATLSFTVAAEAGWRFDVLGFGFQGLGPMGDGSGPTGYAVYSSLDGFANPLIDGSLVGQVPNHRYDYDTGLMAQDLTGPLELRIVSTGRDDLPASSWLLDNLWLSLNVERDGGQVPEPGSLALVAAALLGWRATRRR